ncbi:MAG: GEVED domain-containing protein [Bacteroidota bacterium]
MSLRYSFICCCVLFSFFSLQANGIVAVCQSQVNVSLGPDACTVTITPDMIDGGSYSTSTGPLTRYVTNGYNRAPGTYTVYLNVVDDNNSNSCWSTVTVEDKTTPVVTCTNQTIYLVAPDQPHVVNIGDMVSYSDNCSTTDIINITEVYDATGYGTSPFSASSTDGAGNTGTCSGTVTRVNGEPQNYCSSLRNSFYEHIDRIELAMATNNQVETSGNSGGYKWHYPQGDNILYHGYDYSLTYTPGFRSSAYHEYWRVYLDKNGDGDFTDSGELLHQWNGYGDNSFSFTSPGAFWGWSRIRVVMSYGSYAGPCGGGYGETEDISVYLRPWFTIIWPWFRAADSENPSQVAAASLDVLMEERPVEPQHVGESNLREGLTIDRPLPQAISPTTFKEEVQVYPNPASSGERISVRGLSQSKNKVLLLRDLNGRNIQSFTLTSGDANLLLPSNLPTGIYLLSGTNWTKRILIR